jgi:hypothetical protein
MQGPVSTWLGDRQGNPRNRRLYIAAIPTKFTRFRPSLQDSDQVYKIPIKFVWVPVEIIFIIPKPDGRVRKIPIMTTKDSDKV